MERYTGGAFSFEVTDAHATGGGRAGGRRHLVARLPAGPPLLGRGDVVAHRGRLPGPGARPARLLPGGPARRPVRVPELPAGGGRARPGRRGRGGTVPPGRARLGRGPGLVPGRPLSGAGDL